MDDFLGRIFGWVAGFGCLVVWDVGEGGMWDMGRGVGRRRKEICHLLPMDGGGEVEELCDSIDYVLGDGVFCVGRWKNDGGGRGEWGGMRWDGRWMGREAGGEEWKGTTG